MMTPATPGRPAAVSVCIPTYRGAAYIRQAIESVLAQTWRDFELLVVDDNSPDETMAIVAGYSDPRIRVLQNARNLGPEGNWNRCLDEASGRYFKLLPQDDVLAPTCLERQVAVLEADVAQEIALVFCARTILDATGRVLMVRRYPGGHGGRLAGREVIARCMRWGTNLLGEPGSVLFRRSLARAVGPFDASIPYIVDLDYWVRLLQAGDAHYLPEPLASFRVSGGSWSVAIGKRQSVDYCRFIRKVARMPGYTASRADVLAGIVMARLNAYMRLILYRFVLERGHKA